MKGIAGVFSEHLVAALIDRPVSSCFNSHWMSKVFAAGRAIFETHRQEAMFKADDRIGPYRLIRHLGSGTFGVVWLAQEEKLIRTRQVALKLPTNPDPDLAEIQREAQIWEALGTHPNVVPVYDADVYTGQVAIASEYVSGGSLMDWLKAHGGKAPSVDKAVEITLGTLAGLEHLHANRLIHRDLKPGNILMQGDTPRLTDFGISRVLTTSMHTTNAAGTPAYMSPEMFRGRYSKQSDLWAVGVILYRLLCGGMPFPQQQQVELMYAIVHDPPQPLQPDLPQELQQIVMRALEKEPAARGTVVQMRQELERFLTSLRPLSSPLPVGKPLTGPTVQPPPIPAVPAPRSSRSHLPSNSSGTSQFQIPLQAPPAITPSPGQAAPKAAAPTATPLKPATAPSNPAVTRRVALSVLGIGALGVGIWGVSKRPWDGGSSNGSPGYGNDNSDSNKGSGTSPPATAKTNPIDGAEMILIPAGEFTMGSANNADEKPEHEVMLDGYYIYKTPVTVAQYMKFCDQTGHKKPETPPFNPNWANTDHPIVNVSWDDAEAYCKWASGNRPGSVHLPTEAQWEKAARGPNGYEYPWGNDWDDSKCAHSVSPNTQNGTVKVGSYPANGYGLYDMEGNVWQWCSDFYDEGFYRSPQATERNPENQSAGEKKYRVLRGGSWLNVIPGNFRCALRNYFHPVLSGGSGGFRCAARAD